MKFLSAPGDRADYFVAWTRAGNGVVAIETR